MGRSGETVRSRRAARGGRRGPEARFLGAVETVCRLHHPEATITRREAPAPIGAFLEVAERDGRHVRIEPVGAFSEPLTREALAAFLAHVDAPYRQENRFMRSTLVHAGPPAPEALERMAEERGARLVTFSDYQNVLDFTGYLERQAERLSGDPLYAPRLYVEPRARVEAGGVASHEESALSALWECLRAPHPRFVLVLGDFGTGKTFLLRELSRRMAAARTPPVPVLVSMRSLVRAGSLDALLAQHLSELGMPRPDVQAFRYMLREGQVALLFDGFDELAARVSYDRADAHFDTIMAAAEGQAKIVVTSRTQHFRTKEQLMTALGVRAHRLPGYRVMTLEPFDRDQIRRSLGKLLGDEAAAEGKLARLEAAQGLAGLSKNPRMLRLAAALPEEGLAEASTAGGSVAAAELYRILLEQWIEHEHTRAHPPGAAPGMSREQRWRAVTEIAKRLWATGEGALDLRELPADVEEAVRALEPRALEPEAIRYQLGAGTLLVRDDEGRFSFMHPSVLEWLVARDAAEALAASGEARPFEWHDATDVMIDFWIALAGREEARAWAERVMHAPGRNQAKRNAVRVLRRLREARPTPSARGDKALDLRGMDLRGEDFTAADLRGAKLEGAELSGVALVGANLSLARLAGARLMGADLARASLAGADLTGADLTGASLVGADMRGARLQGSILRRAKLVGVTALDLAACDSAGAALGASAMAPMWLPDAAPRAVVFSPDGTLVASGHEDGTAWIGDAARGHVLRVLRGHRRATTSLAFSPDGRALATGSEDGDVRLWDIATGQTTAILRGRGLWIMSVAFSPDGRTLASGEQDGAVLLWDVSAGVPRATLRGHSDWVRSVAYDPKGQTIASASDDQTIVLWDASTLELRATLRGHADWVTSVSWSPDGKQLASASRDGAVLVWDARAGTSRPMAREPVCRTYSHVDRTVSVAFCPDGQTIAGGRDDDAVVLWDVRTGAQRAVLKGHAERIVGLAWSPDGRSLASASEDRTVRLWDVRAGAARASIRGHFFRVSHVAVSPDGQRLACACRDRTAQIRDVRTGGLIATLRGHAGGVRSVAWSREGSIVATASDDETVRLWDASSGEPRAVLEGHFARVTSVAFCPRGKILASASEDETLRLWDARSGAPRGVLRIGKSRALHLAWSPDGLRLAAGAANGSLLSWSVRQKRLRTARAVDASPIVGVAFGPDGQAVFAASFGGAVIRWDEDADAGRVIFRLEAAPTTCVAFGADGKTLAAARPDAVIRLIDLETGEERAALRGHSASIVGLAFGRDGETVVSAGADGAVRLWSARSGECLAVYLHLPEGWAAFRPDGRYHCGGAMAGAFWHAVGLCRFEPGELDELVPGLRVRDGEGLVP
ncbi:pentapeptide repeat-containing protein [Polyangium aurulentum]|uniref:WD40 domain-containing protein n=1 Tax=Polyangium aurulentum TaxID=2567896 RepID=UPI001469B9CF|nr:pentapeptide repeat-containing protein [Polyangium aurulentum]UQA60134.1 pentapeptide repeat-containing protein [Polyangium aurulentum]